MSYSKNIKSDWQAKLICASDEFLSSLDNQKIEGSKWIWPLFTTRGFLRRDFYVSDAPKTAKIELLCDNAFDVYLNGNLIAENIKALSQDIAAHIQKGENKLALRVFQTNDETRFSSAICGKITVETANGAFCVSTDEAFHNFHPNFSNEEPEGWITEKGIKEAFLVTSSVHPRLVRHSLYMRKSFSAKADIAKAELFVFSKGEAEMYINGEKIANEFFSQGIMERYFEYRVFDVTQKLREGENVLAALTGNGWLNSESHNVLYANKNALLCELKIEYSNGIAETVITDGTWRIALSPITENDLQLGERYDARLEQAGWNEVGFDDSAWSPAAEFDAPSGKSYVERNYPPVKIKEILPVVGATESEEGILYDFGFNSTGKYILSLKNTKRGQKIKISVCEMLKPNGDMLPAPYAPVCNSDDFYKADGKAKAAIRNYDVYICRGGEEQYMPRFAFNGFRYVKVEGATPEQIADIKLACQHNDVAFGWKIESSDPFFEKFARITERTMKCNMMNGFMDCPTREKNFWTGDIAAFAPTACYLADVDALLGRWTDAGRKLGDRHYGWGDEVYIIPLLLYRFYGDKEILKARYADILKYTYDRISVVDGGLPDGSLSPYNDHLNPFGKNLSPAFFASCFYCYNLKCAAEIAKILGDEINANKLHSFFVGARERFNDKYFIREQSDYSEHIQSGLIIPLAFSLVPEECAAAVAARLNQYILEQGSLTTGFIATGYLMQVLCDYGYNDTAFMLLSREEYPSWRNLIKNATTITEHWNGMEPSGCSKNHFTFGSVTGWMFEYLGGIRYRESAPGFKTLYLKPTFIKQIGDFSCEYVSREGVIRSGWEIKGDMVLLSFTTPVETILSLPNGEQMQFSAGTHSLEIKL